MPFIVEDGTGLTTANSYSTVEEADDYFATRNILDWAKLTNSEKEAMLIRGTDYMLQTYRQRWKGGRTNTGQSLCWPRQGVVMDEFTVGRATFYMPGYIANNSIPEEVKKACAELALRASIATLSEDESRKVTQETIGPVTIKYDEYASSGIGYKVVDNLLAPLLSSRSGGGMMKLGRC